VTTATLREPRSEKVAVVNEVSEQLQSSSAAILTEYRGLKVKELEELRRGLSAAGGDYKIYKNTLVKRAANANGLESLVPLLEGPTGIAFVDGDLAQVAKALREFAKTHPSLVIKGGVVGQSFVNAKQTAALADMPSREQLYSMFAGALAAPMVQFAGLIKAVPQKFAYALSALIQSKEGGKSGDQ